MSSKTIKMESAQNLSKANFEALTAELNTITQQRDVFQGIANEAASTLIGIESRFAPLLNRKINFFTALFHIQQFIELIREIIEAIRAFKGKYIPKPEPTQPTV